jgi:hypothetical protein
VSSNLAKDDEFLRAIKVHSMTSFVGEVKPLIPCRKILCYVEESCRYEKRDFVGKIHGYFSPSFSCYACRCVCWFLPEISGG